MSITTEITVESVMAQITSLSFKEQCQVMEQTARALKKADGGSKKQKREKKERDPDAPKREPSDWIKHTTHVRQFLADEHKGVVCTQVASMLKADGKMFPDEADVMDAYARWKENPPVKADKADAKADKAEKKSKTPSASGSVADEASESESGEKGSSAKKERKPRAKMTDEQKAAAKEKREAKKAAKAAEAESDAESVVAPVAASASMPAPVEEAAVEGETKEYTIGKKTKKYDCFPDTENKGCEYLYDNDTGAFVGRYNTVTKKLDTTVDDPAA